MHFVLGPVERWVVGIAAGLLGVLLALVYGGVTSKIDEQAQIIKVTNSTLGNIAMQQAVTNGQIATLTTQLADVPRITREMAETKVRVDRLEQDTKELRQLRGLK